MAKAQKNTWAKKMAQLRRKQEEQEALEDLKKEVFTKWSPYTVEVEVAAQREKETITRSEKKCREDKVRLHQEWTKRHPEVIAIDSKQMIESDSDAYTSPKRKGKSAHYYHTTRLAAWRATRFKSATGTRAKTKGPQQLQGLSYSSFVNNVATLRAKGDSNVAEVQHGGIYRPGGMPLVIPYENKPLKPAERKPLYEKPEPEPVAEEPPPKNKSKCSHAKTTFANGRDKLSVPRSATDGASLTSLSSVCSWCSLQARKPVPPTWIDPNILKAPRTINCIWRKPLDKAIQTDSILVPASKAASREARAEDNWRFLYGVSTSDIVVGRRDSGDSEAKQSRECPTDPEVPVDPELSGRIRDWITSSLADEETDPLQNLPCDDVEAIRPAHPVKELEKENSAEVQSTEEEEQPSEEGPPEEEAKGPTEATGEEEQQYREAEDKEKTPSIHSVPQYIEYVISRSVDDFKKRMEAEEGATRDGSTTTKALGEESLLEELEEEAAHETEEEGEEGEDKEEGISCRPTWLPPEELEMFLKLQSDECAEMESDLNVIPKAPTHDFEKETPRRMTIALYTYGDFQEIWEQEAEQPVSALPSQDLFPEEASDADMALSVITYDGFQQTLAEWAEQDETDHETLVELFVPEEEDTLDERPAEERQLTEGEAQEETTEGERPPDEQGPAEMTAVEPFTTEEEIGEGPCVPG
ncbi:uncharacterized protein [Littorina saxatilis]|uniref:uncharacterized protein n=1 Tax=Littorina saxatilis TaxID=31220 RepID=UPI0038B43460